MPPHRNAVPSSATRAGPRYECALAQSSRPHSSHSLDPNGLENFFPSPALSQAVPTTTPHTSVSCSDSPSPSSSSSKTRATVICRLQGCNKPYNRIPDLLRHMTTGPHREALVSVSPSRARAILAATGLQPKYVDKALKMLETEYMCGCGVAFDRIDTLKRHFKLMGHGPATVPLANAASLSILSPPGLGQRSPALDRWTQPSRNPQLDTFDYPHLSRILDNAILMQPWVTLPDPLHRPGECSRENEACRNSESDTTSL